MPDDDRRDYTARIITVIRTLDGAGLSETDRPMVLQSIMFRLMALARLSKTSDLRGFRLDVPGQEYDMIHADVVRAVVETPLCQANDDFVFDRTEFHDHLLRVATPAGQA